MQKITPCIWFDNQAEEVVNPVIYKELTEGEDAVFPLE
jgi:predicted 3-demethylubiquinone-9 3-methyltransferase (glyoxalase superfamily)